MRRTIERIKALWRLSDNIDSLVENLDRTITNQVLIENLLRVTRIDLGILKDQFNENNKKLNDLWYKYFDLKLQIESIETRLCESASDIAETQSAIDSWLNTDTDQHYADLFESIHSE